MRGSSKRLATELILRNNKGSPGLLKRYVGTTLGVVIEAGDSNLVNEYVIRSEEATTVLTQLAEAYVRFELSRLYAPSKHLITAFS